LTGPFANVPTRSFGPCRSEQHADRSTDLGFDGTDQVEPPLVIGVAAVAEVQPEHVGTRANHRCDGGAVGTCGAERGDDLGVAVAWHQWTPVEGWSMTMARKSFTLVKVGPVTIESPSAPEEAMPVVGVETLARIDPLRPRA
jgi:hypothetical protein